jgi:hypothetical protein
MADAIVKTIGKKILLIPFGLLVGGLLAAVLLAAWDAVGPGPRPVDESDVPALQKLLDENTGPQGLYLYDEEISFRFKPNYRGTRHGTESHPHATNSLGVLGEREIDSSVAVKNVLFLGDSVTYGDGVPFDAVFVSCMQQRAGESYQLLNAACPGWNTRQEVQFFRRFLAEENWQAIVLVFCLNDHAEYQWAVTPDGRYEIVMRESLEGTLQKSITQWKLARVRARFGDSPAAQSLAQHDDAMLLAWDDSRWQSYENAELIPLLEERQRPPLIVVAVPTLYQLESVAAGASPELAFLPQRRLATQCIEHGVSCVDVSEAFNQPGAPPAADCYSVDDYVHFSETGHALVGAYLWPKVKQALDRVRP